eukprot:14913561-Heterocapsa_arctica.AAC.1
MASVPVPPNQLNGEDDHIKWPELIGEHFRKQFDCVHVERTFWASNMRKSLLERPPLDFEISTEETLDAIASMATDKTCASDGIVAEMLQALDRDN